MKRDSDDLDDAALADIGALMALFKIVVAILGLAAIGIAFYHGLETGRWQVMGVGILAGIVFLVVAGWQEIAILKFGKDGLEVVKRAEAVTAKAEAALESLKKIAVLGAHGTQTSILHSGVPIQERIKRHNEFLSELSQLGLQQAELEPIRQRWTIWIAGLFRMQFERMLQEEYSRCEIIDDIWETWSFQVTKEAPPSPDQMDKLVDALTEIHRGPGNRTKARIRAYRDWFDRGKLDDPNDFDNRESWRWKD